MHFAQLRSAVTPPLSPTSYPATKTSCIAVAEEHASTSSLNNGNERNTAQEDDGLTALTVGDVFWTLHFTIHPLPGSQSKAPLLPLPACSIDVASAAAEDGGKEQVVPAAKSAINLVFETRAKSSELAEDLDVSGVPTDDIDSANIAASFALRGTSKRGFFESLSQGSHKRSKALSRTIPLAIDDSVSVVSPKVPTDAIAAAFQEIRQPKVVELSMVETLFSPKSAYEIFASEYTSNGRSTTTIEAAWNMLSEERREDYEMQAMEARLTYLKAKRKRMTESIADKAEKKPRHDEEQFQAPSEKTDEQPKSDKFGEVENSEVPDVANPMATSIEAPESFENMLRAFECHDAIPQPSQLEAEKEPTPVAADITFCAEFLKQNKDIFVSESECLKAALRTWNNLNDPAEEDEQSDIEDFDPATDEEEAIFEDGDYFDDETDLSKRKTLNLRDYYRSAYHFFRVEFLNKYQHLYQPGQEIFAAARLAWRYIDSEYAIRAQEKKRQEEAMNGDNDDDGAQELDEDNDDRLNDEAQELDEANDDKLNDDDADTTTGDGVKAETEVKRRSGGPNAFHLFRKEFLEEHKDDYQSKQEALSAMSLAWKDLDANARKGLQERAKEIRRQYDEEDNDDDDGALQLRKNTIFGFNLFRKQFLNQHKSEYQNGRDALQAAGAAWRTLETGAQKEYIKHALELKKREVEALALEQSNENTQQLDNSTERADDAIIEDDPILAQLDDAAERAEEERVSFTKDYPMLALEKPKRPRSAYNIFVAEFNHKTSGSVTRFMEKGAMMKSAAMAWKKLSDEERKPYEALGAEEKAKAKPLMMEYRRKLKELKLLQELVVKEEVESMEELSVVNETDTLSLVGYGQGAIEELNALMDAAMMCGSMTDFLEGDSDILGMFGSTQRI
ncbi:hypothetical protein HDV05_003880 [Chytridiales sp. JEL 0842]|nr:hypothetical protein HDV05_003880 [Chytridiales sp. JEL 0842]